MPPPRTPWTMVRVEVVGEIYKQVQFFTYLRGIVTETLDVFDKIAVPRMLDVHQAVPM